MTAASQPALLQVTTSGTPLGGDLRALAGLLVKLDQRPPVRLVSKPAPPPSKITKMSKSRHAANGYVEGAVVRQYQNTSRFDEATIVCVHDNGALDVEMAGQRYGWSVETCKPVDHVLSPNPAPQ